ncbi:MAG: YmdB family metallophosphoesterase [Oligoflexales bacterium]
MTNSDKPSRIIVIGDVVGRAGRRCLKELLPKLKTSFSPDLIIANGENSAGGFGITKKIFLQMINDLGISAVTTGNHWHDKKEIYSFKDQYANLLLPANMYNVDQESKGYCLLELGDKKVAIINLTGRVFMKGDNRCPFETFDRIYDSLKEETNIFIVDFHGEATSEKQAFAQYVRNRCTLLYGTHTHCPTADERIFDHSMGYVTDVGMTGSYDSVIGVKTSASLGHFLGKGRAKFEPSNLEPWLCALLCTIDLSSGKCIDLRRERLKFTEEAVENIATPKTYAMPSS